MKYNHLPNGYKLHLRNTGEKVKAQFKTEYRLLGPDNAVKLSGVCWSRDSDRPTGKRSAGLVLLMAMLLFTGSDEDKSALSDCATTMMECHAKDMTSITTPE